MEQTVGKASSVQVQPVQRRSTMAELGYWGRVPSMRWWKTRAYSKQNTGAMLFERLRRVFLG